MPFYVFLPFYSFTFLLFHLFTFSPYINNLIRPCAKPYLLGMGEACLVFGVGINVVEVVVMVAEVRTSHFVGQLRVGQRSVPDLLQRLRLSEGVTCRLPCRHLRKSSCRSRD